MIPDNEYQRLVVAQQERHALRAQIEHLKREGRDVPEGLSSRWAELCREIAQLTEGENVST